MLKPVSCDHVTEFNYDDKNARDVGLTCSCHLSNVMPDSIFHESMRQGITCSVSFCLFVFSYLFVVCFLFFFRRNTSVFLRMKEMEPSVDMGKFKV